ncbi:putative inorganic phosphate cotransporter [Copidosoma floridanum]|uniref:putative inorganic phosphate cotransporter n=1 Tax=Copidosoma floridanum TaxID=29053 RepID=UPI0006C93D7B|nr:putative inorganic phosphate cotransporter [Copidosoma floridanum]
MAMTPNWCSVIPQRWVYVSLAFVALVIGNATRSVLPITITEMVVPIREASDNHTRDKCFRPESHVLDRVPASTDSLYDWTEYTQGVILSSIFWVYGPMQIVYGPLIERFGAKYFMAQAVFVPSLMTFLTPWIIDQGGTTALIIARFVMGASSSALFPAVSSMTPHWTTPQDRSRIGSFICAGFNLGPVFGTVGPALIIKYSGHSWPAVFYVFGAIGMLWLPFWLLLCYNNSDEHPFVGELERKYLQESQRGQVSRKPPPPPYRQILRSKQFWAFAIALLGYDWALFLLSSDLNKFMKNVIGLPIDKNGYVSALPYLCIWLNSLLTSWLMDRILARTAMSVTSVKKSFGVVATIGPSLFIVGASYAGCDANLVSASFVVGMTLMGCGYVSIVTNNLDLSPNYASTLVSIANAVAGIGGIVSPYLVGVLTPNQTIGEWRLVFWIGFAVTVLTNLFYLRYASGKVQSWNDRDAVEPVEFEMVLRSREDGKTRGINERRGAISPYL